MKTLATGIIAAVGMMASPVLAAECCKKADCHDTASHSEHHAKADVEAAHAATGEMDQQQKQQLRAHIEALSRMLAHADAECTDCAEIDARDDAAMCEDCGTCHTDDCAKKA